jgi:hypothetical protein
MKTSFSKASATMAAVFVLACAGYASGAVVMYNESVSGDLPGIGSPLPTMALDVGTNTVTGRINGIQDSDSFAFTVPVGAQLVSANVAATDVAGSSGDISVLEWILNKGSANFRGGTPVDTIDVESPGTTTFSMTPLGSNTYNLSQNSIDSTGAGSSDYTFTFVVAATSTAAPEAGTLTVWLTLFGLAVGAKTCRKLVVGKR